MIQLTPKVVIEEASDRVRVIECLSVMAVGLSNNNHGSNQAFEALTTTMKLIVDLTKPLINAGPIEQNGGE